MQVWLFVGVLLILGSGNRWIIPLIASLVFTAIVILVPAIYEYVLNERQKKAISSAAGKLLPGRKQHNSWGNLPHLPYEDDAGVVVKDTGKDVDGLPTRRH